jgi:hypothetical protein
MYHNNCLIDIHIFKTNQRKSCNFKSTSDFCGQVDFNFAKASRGTRREHVGIRKSDNRRWLTKIKHTL